MLKPIFQLIGFLVVILILLLAVLFYLDGKDLLSGELADFIGSLRALFDQIKAVVTSFVNESVAASNPAARRLATSTARSNLICSRRSAINSLCASRISVSDAFSP